MTKPKSNKAIGFFILIFLLICNLVYSQPSKDGARTITSPGVVVNDYTTLTADASAGNNSIVVASNTLSGNFTAALATGDLIYIIQIQGASIVGIDDPTYGNIISYNNCGR